jgi:hypothetical protein
MPITAIPVSARMKLPILHIAMVDVSGEDTLAIHYPIAPVRANLSALNFKHYEGSRKWDNSILPASLSFSVIGQKLGKNPDELAVFALGSPSAKRNQFTYLSVFEKWMNNLSGINFYNLRSDHTKYTDEVQKLLANGTLNEFETYFKSWYNGSRVGPSGDAQDIVVR